MLNQKLLYRKLIIVLNALLVSSDESENFKRFYSAIVCTLFDRHKLQFYNKLKN